MAEEEKEMRVELSNLLTRMRIMAILTVVAYHAACPYIAWCWQPAGGGNYDFHFISDVYHFLFLQLLDTTMLPSFFLISGTLFYARKEAYANRLATFWKKFDRLMVPYAIIGVLAALWNLPQIGIAGASGHLWFLETLFTFFVLSLLAFHINEKCLLAIGFVGFLIYSFQSKLGVILPPFISYLLHYYLFFVGGWLVNVFFDKMLYRRKKLGVAVILVWLGALILGLQTIYHLTFCVMLVCILPLTAVKNKLCLLINKYSFSIYLVHHLLIFALFPLSPFQWLYLNQPFVAIPTMFLSLMLLSFGVGVLLNRVGFKYF